MFFAHVWLRSVLSWLFEHHKPHRIWYFSLLIRVAFICASYISCIQNTWPFYRSPECFATSLVAEMLTCVGKSDLSLHEILVSVKPFVSEWNRSRLQLLIHTQLYMGEARKFKLTLFILFNLNQLTNETVNAGFACNALLLCQLRNVFKNKGEKTSSVRVACTFILFVWVMSPSSHFLCLNFFFLALLKLICGSLCERWTDCGNLSRYRCF